jgi:hypothetical protein
MGKGTAQDGKADVNLPNICSYSTTEDVRDMGIEIEFAGGSLSGLKFAN